MAWLKNGDDDWLAEATPPVSVRTSSITNSLEQSIAVLDLTVAEPIESLQALPDAPPCTILPTPRHLKFIQEHGVCCVSNSSEMDLNVALACSSHVILIFSIMGSHSFDGYGIMQGCVGEVGQAVFNPSDYYSNLHVRPVLVRLIRKGAVHFSQVGHIRDNTGLGGKGVSTAKDGVRLGIAAGRTLCRSIDKRAFKDDPVHYKDFRVTPDIFPDSAGIQVCAVRQPELRFLQMEYEQYVDWYNGRGHEDIGPTLRHIFS